MYNFSLWCMRIIQNLHLFFAESVPNFILLLFLLFFLLSYPRSFLLFASFFLAGNVWTKSSVNPEKGTLINYRCVGLFMHRFCTKNAACFFRLAPSECSRYTKCMVLWKDQSTLCQFFFCILFVYCFIKLNIQFQQKRNAQHKNKKYNYLGQKSYNLRVYRTYNLT